MTNDNNNPPRGRSQRTQYTAEEIRNALRRFTGGDGYYLRLGGISLVTHGVQYLCETAECDWLIDAIGSYQIELTAHPDERLQSIQFWTLKVNADRSAMLTCRADSDVPPAVRQVIEFTDFPLPEIDIWVGIEEGRRIALLPSEY